MKFFNVFKLASVAVLSLGLTSCFISGTEEASIALAKWQGKKINDFFFAHGKGEFQAQNSQGKKAYIWSSPKRQIEVVGETIVVKVADDFIPGKYHNEVIIQPSTYYTRQCILRIETTASGRILTSQNVNSTGECARYFSLSQAEIDALLEARK